MIVGINVLPNDKAYKDEIKRLENIFKLKPSLDNAFGINIETKAFLIYLQREHKHKKRQISFF